MRTLSIVNWLMSKEVLLKFKELVANKAFKLLSVLLMQPFMFGKASFDFELHSAQVALVFRWFRRVEKLVNFEIVVRLEHLQTGFAKILFLQAMKMEKIDFGITQATNSWQITQLAN